MFWYTDKYMNYPGKYIVIEGIDGAGKDTQEELLQNVLPKDTVFTREPRGTEIGETLREIIVTKEIDPISEVLLFYAARRELMNRVIIPALREGKTVVSNRNELATYAYQIHGRERQDLLSLTDVLSKEVLGDIQPDFVLYYDIPVSVKKERIAGRPEQLDSFDELAEEFFERAREGYQKHIQKYSHAIIDASGTIEEVHVLTKKALADFID